MGQGGGGGGGKGGGEGGVGRDPDYIIFLNHTFLPQFTNKTLIAYKHVSYVLWEEVSAHVLLLFSQMVLVSIYRRLIYNF